jgi:meso-butanediol dehydrogenase/(S,S)-butanediol dehydrogenase/diacetyl reductase
VSGRLAGKRVLITGTAGGQGAAAARRFVAEGARVVGCDLDAARAAAVAEEGGFTAFGGVDLADADAATGWIADAVGVLGGVDILYNNASATRVGPFEDVTLDDWRFVLRNELDLIFTVTHAAWEHLATARGLVINTASVSAWRGAAFTEQAAHGAAKGGVLAITRHLAASGAKRGIRANSVSPGLTVTPQIQEFLDDPSRPMHGMEAAHPLGRLGQPDDVAKVALFLASDDAAYLNAIDIVVDGGQSVIV